MVARKTVLNYRERTHKKSGDNKRPPYVVSGIEEDTFWGVGLPFVKSGVGYAG